MILAHWKPARRPLRASVARTCSVGPRLFIVDRRRTTELPNRCRATISNPRNKPRTYRTGPRYVPGEEPSNLRIRIGGQRHAVDGEAATALLFGGFHARILGEAGPLPVLWPLHQTSFHGYEDEAVIEERAAQPGHAINLCAMSRGCKIEPNSARGHKRV